MLEETYIKFKKNILPRMKKKEPDLQDPTIEYCDPQQILNIYNHYPVIEKVRETTNSANTDNDIYDTTEIEHEFKYGIYEDIVKTEEFMAELKRIDEAEHEQKKIRDIHFDKFPLEKFADEGKVANEGDPHLKAAADNELYELEKRAIEIEPNENIQSDKYKNRKG